MTPDVKLSDFVDPTWTALKVKDECMTPGLPAGSIIWYDQNDKQPMQGELFVFDLSHPNLPCYPIVRRYQRTGIDSILLESDCHPDSVYRNDIPIKKGDKGSCVMLGRVKLAIVVHDRWAKMTMAKHSNPASSLFLQAA